MTMTQQEAMIAILIHKLGGEVTITPRDLSTADDLELTQWYDPVSMGTRFTAKFPPVELVGELVDDETFADKMARQSLEALNDDWRKKQG